MQTQKMALLSVFDKTGVVEFARGLIRNGYQILSSGGTARLLTQNDVPVVAVADYIDSPEILGGRVKTLHPRLFGGILARDIPEHVEQLRAHDMHFVDVVAVNLYPFEDTVDRVRVESAQSEAKKAEQSIAVAVEQIDIGGPSMVRAAAKNHERVAIAVDPDDYAQIITEMDANDGRVGAETRLRLAAKAFAKTAAYEASISNYFQQCIAENEAWPERLSVQLTKAQGLRYGENPHQSGAAYAITDSRDKTATLSFTQIQGKELSYNNLVDADAAWALAQDLPGIGVCVIKHTNPCGAASATSSDIADIYARALDTDPVSAFGGIVACNGEVNEAMASRLAETFLEAVIAPEFAQGALAILSKKKKLRVLQARLEKKAQWVWRAALGGLLLQQRDQGVEAVSQAKIVTESTPDEKQIADMQFAWAVCKHVKSNAIVFAKDGQLIGVGAGQMSRVDSVKLAVSKARLPLEGSVLASDAFFPFRDGVDEAAKAGAKVIVQPGGSVRDADAIGAANEHGMAMVFTGRRHFRH